MSKKVIINFVLLFIFLSVSISKAQYIGGTPGEIFRWGTGGRALAMGQAYVAFADDATACYWNPAGLAEVISYQASLMWFNLFEDVNYFNFASAINLPFYWNDKKFFKCLGSIFGPVGLNFIAIRTSGIEQYDLIDGQISYKGTFGCTEGALLCSRGGKIPIHINKLSVMLEYGFTGKWLFRNWGDLDRENTNFSSNIGWDLGFRLKNIGDLPIAIGLQMQNVSMKELCIAKTKINEDRMPLSCRFGVSWNLLQQIKQKVIVNFDINTVRKHEDYRLGAEWMLPIEVFDKNMLSFRAGIRINNYNLANEKLQSDLNKEFTFGIGIRASSTYSADLSIGEEGEIGCASLGGSRFRASINFNSSSYYEDIYDQAIDTTNNYTTRKWLLRKISEDNYDESWISRAWYGLGDLEFKEGNDEKAIKCFDNAIKIDTTIEKKKNNKQKSTNDKNDRNNDYDRYQTYINYIMLKIDEAFEKNNKKTWEDVKQIYHFYYNPIMKADENDWWYNYLGAIIYQKILAFEPDEDQWKEAAEKYKVLIGSDQTGNSLRSIFHFNLATTLLNYRDENVKGLFTILLKKYRKSGAIDTSIKLEKYKDYYCNNYKLNEENTPCCVIEHFLNRAKSDSSGSSWKKAKEIYEFYDKDDWQYKGFKNSGLYKYFGAAIYHKYAEANNNTVWWRQAKVKYDSLKKLPQKDNLQKIIFKLNCCICCTKSNPDISEIDSTIKILELLIQAHSKKVIKSDSLNIFKFTDERIVDDALYYLGECYLNKCDTYGAMLEFAKVILLYPFLEKSKPATDKIKTIISTKKKDKEEETNLTIYQAEEVENAFDEVFCYPYDLMIDHNNGRYIAEAGNSQIKILNTDRCDSINYIELKFPTALDVYNNIVYIADPIANRVFKGRISEQDLDTFERGYNFNMPIDICISNDMLYIVNFEESSILKYNLASFLTRDDLTPIEKKYQMIPVNIAVSRNNEIYVADWLVGSIVKIDRNGSITDTFTVNLNNNWLPIHLNIDQSFEENSNDEFLYAVYWNLENNQKCLLIFNLDAIDINQNIKKVDLQFASRSTDLEVRDGRKYLLVLEQATKSKIKRIQLYK
ncbi:MAG: tetratricopeptide repeat protein [Ignavibacteriales bacterium]|nr:tetratricopeptide repeat protein [Ignavibacteriales bacterium]